MCTDASCVQVAARRAAVRARLPRRSWAGIISYMYRTSTEPVDTVRLFGPKLNSKYIDKNGSGERARMQKTWNKCTPLPRTLRDAFVPWHQQSSAAGT